MLLQGTFKLMEAKFIHAKATVGINEDRLHPSCDPCSSKRNETIRNIWLFTRRSLVENDDQKKPTLLSSDKRYS